MNSCYKALMDRNVPLGVSENTLDGFIKSKELIDQWHNKVVCHVHLL